MKQSRRAARSLAFQVLYSLSFNTPDNLEALQVDFMKAVNMKEPTAKPEAAKPEQAAKSEQDKTQAKAQGKAQDDSAQTPTGFAWELVCGVWSRQAELDKIISGFSERWKVERLGRIELTLLRMGVFELHYNRDVPIKVIISEALELAKQFADQKALAFINGILDSAAKDIKVQANSE